MSIHRGGSNTKHSDFEWSKFVAMLNGSDFKWHSKTQQPDHTKSDQIAGILDLYALALSLNGQDYSYAPDNYNT